MNKEQVVLKQMILWLWKHHERATRNFRDKTVDLYEIVKARYPSFYERELEDLLNSPFVNFLKHNKFLFLMPPEDDEHIFPVLTLMYDFRSNRTSPEFRIRLALFVFDGDENPKAVGYRFESPESGDKHNYHHAQPIRSFNVSGTELLPHCPEWLPSKYPTFTLDAQNIPSLFVSLLISLYGVRFVQEMRKDSGLGNLLNQYLDGKMACLHSPVRPLSTRKKKRHRK